MIAIPTSFGEKNGMKRVTLKEVAVSAKVSVQTASHVLNEKFRSRYHPDTCQRVLSAAETLGYRPNAAARSMLINRSHIIGVIVPKTIGGWFFQLDLFETMLGMNELLADKGYVTSIIPVGRLQAPGGVSRALREQMLDGVVAISWMPDELQAQVEAIAPVSIWCDTNVDRERGCIRRDEHFSGKTVADHVIALGYQKIVWVTYAVASAHYSSAARFAGISESAQKRNIPIETIHVTQTNFGEESTLLVKCMTPETVFITEHHHFAQGLANLAQRNDRKPGRDFGLAACDHSRERASVFPELSRVVIDRTETGFLAAEMILKALENDAKLPPSKLIRGTWFEGTTTRRVS